MSRQTVKSGEIGRGEEELDGGGWETRNKKRRRGTGNGRGRWTGGRRRQMEMRGMRLGGMTEVG